MSDIEPTKLWARIKQLEGQIEAYQDLIGLRDQRITDLQNDLNQLGKELDARKGTGIEYQFPTAQLPPAEPVRIIHEQVALNYAESADSASGDCGYDAIATVNALNGITHAILALNQTIKKQGEEPEMKF